MTPRRKFTRNFETFRGSVWHFYISIFEARLKKMFHLWFVKHPTCFFRPFCSDKKRLVDDEYILFLLGWCLQLPSNFSRRCSHSILVFVLPAPMLSLIHGWKTLIRRSSCSLIFRLTRTAMNCGVSRIRRKTSARRVGYGIRETLGDSNGFRWNEKRRYHFSDREWRRGMCRRLDEDCDGHSSCLHYFSMSLEDVFRMPANWDQLVSICLGPCEIRC